MQRPHGGERFDQVALTLFRNKHAGATEQKFVIFHPPKFSCGMSLIWRRQVRDFDPLIYDRYSFPSDSRIDQALCDILAVGHKSLNRFIPSPRTPASS